MANLSLRAKGAPISEPRFSTLRDMGKIPNGHFPRVAWKNRMSQGVENRGSLISVPVAQGINRFFLQKWVSMSSRFPGRAVCLYGNCRLSLRNGSLSFKNGLLGPLRLGAQGVGTFKGISRQNIQECPSSRFCPIHRV